MKIYISGPMTGLPDLNFPAFHAEAKRLRELGFEVVNPAELNPDGGSWEECLKKDIAELIKCDGIFMLPGWDNSKGAVFEFEIASHLKIEAFNHIYEIPLPRDCDAPKYINPKCDLCKGSGVYMDRPCDGVTYLSDI